MFFKILLIALTVSTCAAHALAGVEATVNDLVPKLASSTVADRLAPQMELQALAANAARPDAENERVALATLLASKAADSTVPQPARVWIVRQLEYIGAMEAVPALTALLADADTELQECARRALERNPAPEATKSLRDALAKANPGTFKIGLLQALGQRADVEAVSLIVACLDAPLTARAALSALGEIANPAAAKALWAAFERQTPGASDALIVAARKSIAKGDLKGAAAIYARLYAASTGQPWRPAALVGMATADPIAARPLLAEAVSGEDPRLQGAALSVVGTVYSQGRAAFLAPLLPGLKGSAKVRLLNALTSTADAEAEMSVQTAASDADEAVRLAALETLGRIGGLSSVPVLIQAAAEGNASAQKAAATALARLSGHGVEAALVQQAGEGELKKRGAALQALADRHDASALPAIWKLVSDPAVSSAALAALAKVGADPEIQPLAKLVLAGNNPGADAALQSVAARVTDQAGAVARLIALVDSAPSQRVGVLFETLAVLGGDEALAAVTKAAASPSDEVKDAALRSMAAWSDFAATKPLLAIAKDPNVKRVHNVLALQGVARLVQSADKGAPGERVDAALAALNAAQRPEEKKLALSALASVVNRKAAEAMKPLLSDPVLQNEAGLAAVSLAESLVRPDRSAAKSLAQAIKNAGASANVLRRAEVVLAK